MPLGLSGYPLTPSFGYQFPFATIYCAAAPVPTVTDNQNTRLTGPLNIRIALPNPTLNAREHSAKIVVNREYVKYNQRRCTSGISRIPAGSSELATSISGEDPYCPIKVTPTPTMMVVSATPIKGVRTGWDLRAARGGLSSPETNCASRKRALNTPNRQKTPTATIKTTA